MAPIKVTAPALSRIVGSHPLSASIDREARSWLGSGFPLGVTIGVGLAARFAHDPRAAYERARMWASKLSDAQVAAVVDEAEGEAYGLLQRVEATKNVPAEDMRNWLLMLVEMRDQIDSALQVLASAGYASPRLRDIVRRADKAAHKYADAAEAALGRRRRRYEDVLLRWVSS